MPDGTLQEAPRHQVGRAIRLLRGGESQDAVAQRAGITQQALSAIENGARDARIGTLGKIASALGQPLEALMRGPLDGAA